MPRGGKRPGAGRPRKPVEQHLAEGTFRPHRHRHLLSRPLVPARGRKKTALERLNELLTGEHWRFSRRQVHLARNGPNYVFYDWFIGSPEAHASVAEWQQWNERYGFAWRMQNECPSFDDQRLLASTLGFSDVYFLTPEQFVAAVDDKIANWDPRLPDPPRWHEVDLPQQPEPGGRAQSAGAAQRARCGHCGAKLIMLPASVAATIPKRNLPRTRLALGRLEDGGFRYALADQANHFPCPSCGEDQYAGPEPASK